MEAITVTPKQSESSIHWKQLWSLAALYGSVVIGWIAYYRYQPKLLAEFQFTGFTLPLIIVQAIVLVVTPPLAGRIGDKYRFRQGHRLPIITAGMSFAAMIFMAVAFTLISNPGDVLKWMLPVLIVCWLVGMSIFTSPALSTVELFVPVDKLPRAMAVLTVVANLVNALEPVIVDIIDYIGAPATFIAGGAAVFLSGYALKKTSLGLFKAGEQEAAADAPNTKSRYGFILLTGLCLGVATTLLFNFFPDRLELVAGSLLNGLSGNTMVALILVISAVLSLPLSNLVSKTGLEQALWWGTGGVLICAAAIFLLPSAALVLVFAVLFSAGFTMLSVSTLPLVIREASFREKVFCVGIFYSAVALPDSLADVMLGF